MENLVENLNFLLVTVLLSLLSQQLPNSVKTDRIALMRAALIQHPPFV